MLKKLFLLVSFLSFFTAANLNAQVEDSVWVDEDSLWTDNDEGWEWDWDWDEDWWSWDQGRPAIEFSYGLGKPAHKKLANSFADVAMADIRLGYISLSDRSEHIFSFKERYLFFSKMGTSLKSEKSPNYEISSDMIRFGFTRRSGYGYDLGGIKIFPYSENSAAWSRFKAENFNGLTVPANISVIDLINDSEILNRFNNEFRFGTLTEGGIRIEAGSMFSVNAGYEAAVIFPRYLFWKHMGSLIIETAGLNALDNFVEEVFDSSPAATPVVNFLLKNGFSYLFYTLKKDKMNWPFNTETPLTYETFKFGVTFTF